MSSPDGPEQREAEAQEQSWVDDERIDRDERLADESRAAYNYSMSELAAEVRKATADSIDTITRLTDENETLHEDVARLRRELHAARHARLYTEFDLLVLP